MATAANAPYETKCAEAEEGGGRGDGGFRTIELGPGGGGGGGTGEAQEEAGPSPLPSLRSLKSGSLKTRRLEWNVKNYTVKPSRKRTLNILRDVVGRAEAGSLNAIMGPSGCGKTSLLDCIALRNRSFEGTLRQDGKPLTGAYFLDTGACVLEFGLWIRFKA